MSSVVNIREFKDLLFKRGREYGFGDMEIYMQSSKNFDVNVFNSEIDKYNISGNMGLCFRGIYKGKMGYSFTESLDEESVDMLITNAADNALLIESSEIDEIYGGGDNYSDFKGYNPGLEDVSPEDKIKFAMDMEKLAYNFDKRIHSVDECLVSTGEDEKVIINTKGLDVNFRNNTAIAYVSVVAKDSSDIKTGEGFKIDGNFEEMDPAALSSTAVNEAVSMFGAKPVDSGSYPVILRHDAAYRLLRTFSSVFSADNVQKGLSLLNGKLGLEIASDRVNLVDDPLLRGSYSSAPFDDEGVAARYKEVISGGKLNTLLHSLKTARKDGVQSTGNASRASYKSPVEVAPTNMYIKPGLKSYDELAELMGEGLIITDIQGLHSGANQISGDFSLSARGFYIKNGRVESAVEQITIAGNFYQVLKDIIEVGSDLEFSLPARGSTVGSPSLLVRSLAVSGK